MMGHMPAIPESTRSSIILRLLDHAEKNWPQLAKMQARYRGSFAYITGIFHGGEQIHLEHPPDLVDLHLCERARPADPGVVDQDIYPSEHLLCPGDKFASIVGGGQVGY